MQGIGGSGKAYRGTPENIIEYRRVRENLNRILRNAEKDDIPVEDLKEAVPAKPQRITEASIRKITQKHQQIKEEVAKRRRLEKTKIIRTPALDNLRKMIKEGINFYNKKEVETEKGTKRRLSKKYREMVRKAARQADKLVSEAIKSEQQKVRRIHPDWKPIDILRKASENVSKRVEKLLRDYSDDLEKFIYGYVELLDDTKPVLYMLFRDILGIPLSPKEKAEVLEGDGLIPFEFDEYE